MSGDLSWCLQASMCVRLDIREVVVGLWLLVACILPDTSMIKLIKEGDGVCLCLFTYFDADVLKFFCHSRGILLCHLQVVRFLPAYVYATVSVAQLD